MSKNYFDITLALAGVSQSVRLVQQLAHQGQCDEKFLKVTIQSLLDLNPLSVLSVYGEYIENLKMGLEILISIINSSSRDILGAELTRYTLGLMVLERRLYSNKFALNMITNRINVLNRQLEHFNMLSETIINSISAIYVEIISPLGPRIKVIGKPEILKNRLIQAKIRAVLLAGIRSTVLWRQVEGRRLQLIFKRSCLLSEAKKILSSIINI